MISWLLIFFINIMHFLITVSIYKKEFLRMSKEFVFDCIFYELKLLSISVLFSRNSPILYFFSYFLYVDVDDLSDCGDCLKI